MIQWLISVFSTVLIVSLLTVILPEGKLAKFAKPLISLIVIVVVIAPLFNVDTDTESFISIGNAEIKTDEQFLGHVTRSKIDLYTKNCIKIAEKNGINDSEILIEYTIEDDFAINITGVFMNLKNAVISSEGEHIDILQRTKENISEYLGIDLSKVKVYE